MSYNFFIANNLLASIGSLVVSFMFFTLMYRNIRYVQRLKKEKHEKEEK